MWKDFFYYSKSERRAVYVLLTLIALLLVVTFISLRRDPQNFEPIAGTTAQTDSFLSENRMIKNVLVTKIAGEEECEDTYSEEEITK